MTIVVDLSPSDLDDIRDTPDDLDDVAAVGAGDDLLAAAETGNAVDDLARDGDDGSAVAAGDAARPPATGAAAVDGPQVGHRQAHLGHMVLQHDGRVGVVLGVTVLGSQQSYLCILFFVK